MIFITKHERLHMDGSKDLIFYPQLTRKYCFSSFVNKKNTTQTHMRMTQDENDGQHKYHKKQFKK